MLENSHGVQNSVFVKFAVMIKNSMNPQIESMDTQADDFIMDFSDSWVIDMQSVNHFINI
jgi:hypothetical protein